jgi:hypothetical protein
MYIHNMLLISAHSVTASSAPVAGRSPSVPVYSATRYMVHTYVCVRMIVDHVCVAQYDVDVYDGTPAESLELGENA